MHVYKLFWELNSALLQKAFHRVVGERLGVTYFFPPVDGAWKGL